MKRLILVALLLAGGAVVAVAQTSPPTCTAPCDPTTSFNNLIQWLSDRITVLETAPPNQGPAGPQGPQGIQGPPGPAGTGVMSVSQSGTSIKPGDSTIIIDARGAVWAIGASGYIYRDAVNTPNGWQTAQLVFSGGKVYHFGLDNKWYVWSDSTNSMTVTTVNPLARNSGGSIIGTANATMLGPVGPGASPVAAPAAGFWVAPASSGGSDSNPGTQANPFLTVAKCQSAMRASGGSTLICNIRSGTYSLSSPLTLTSSDNGQTWQNGDAVLTAVFDGGSSSGSTGTNWGFVINGGSNITIQGLKFQNFTFGDVVVRGGASFEGQFSATGTANANTVKNNELGRTFSASILNGNGGNMYIEGQATNTKVFNNAIHDATGMCLAIHSNSDSSTPNDNTSGSDIENNAIWNCAGGDQGAFYAEDLTSGCNNTGCGSLGNKLINNLIWGYQVQANVQSGGRCMYFDEGASGWTVTGNICGPAQNANCPAGGQDGTTAIFLSTGFNMIVKDNIIDLGSTSCVVPVTYLRFPSPPPNFTNVMSGNQIQNNIQVGSWSGGSNACIFGVCGVAYNGSGSFPAPTISNNAYTQYGAGSNLPTSGGGSLSGDSSPQTISTTNLKCTGTYVIDPTSTAVTGATAFTPIVGGWGPPGFTPSISPSPTC